MIDQCGVQTVAEICEIRTTCCCCACCARECDRCVPALSTTRQWSVHTTHTHAAEMRRLHVLTARCYASAVLAMALCPSVSVRLSQVGVLLKRLNIGSHKQHRTIPQGLQFSEAKDLREIRPGSPPTGAQNAGGVGQNRPLSTNNRLYLEKGKR